MKRLIAGIILALVTLIAIGGITSVARAEQPEKTFPKAVPAAEGPTVAAANYAVAVPCEAGTTIRVRYNRPLPCEPNSSNTVNVWWPKNWGANHVQSLCAEMGGIYVAGPRARNCYDVDIGSISSNGVVSVTQGLRVQADAQAACPSATPVLQKHNELPDCNYDGDNVVIFWWPQNYGQTFVQGECADIGGKYERARPSRAMHFCVDVDF